MSVGTVFYHYNCKTLVFYSPHSDSTTQEGLLQWLPHMLGSRIWLKGSAMLGCPKGRRRSTSLDLHFERRPSSVSMSQRGASSRVTADSADAIRGPEERQADPATRLVVDELILDYLLYMASKVILEDRKAEKGGVQLSPQDCRADVHLSMVDGRWDCCSRSSRQYRLISV